MSDESPEFRVGLPLPDEQVFRYRAMDDILELLFRNPNQEFSVSELRATTDHGGKTVDNALELLEALELVDSEYRGRQRLVRIDHDQVTIPDDPLTKMPDGEFRKPVAAFLDEVAVLDGLAGVVLFGSVASGTADRTSDVDLLVLVSEDRLDARREIQGIVSTLERRRFDGDRYEFHPMVESIESAKNYGRRLTEILAEGIVLHRTDTLDALKEDVLHGG